MALDVRSARVVIACARHGSLGQASVALNMTQPAVSRILQRLEDGLGVTLFERTTRGVSPTEYGQAVLPHAELVIAEIAAAEDMVRQMQGAHRGTIRVGGVASVMAAWVPAAIADVRRRFPNLVFHVTEELEDTLMENLRRGDIDLAVAPVQAPDPDIVHAVEDRMADRVSAFARRGHPIHADPRMEALARLDWALPPPATPIYHEWHQRFRELGLEPRAPTLISRSVPAIKAAVLGEDFACWLPHALVEAELRSGTLLEIDAEGFRWRRTFRIYRRRRGLATPATTVFARALAAVASEGR